MARMAAMANSVGREITDETVHGWADEVNRYHVSVGWEGFKAEEKYAEGHTLLNYWHAWNHTQTDRQRIGLIKEYADFVAYGAKLRSIFAYYDNLIDHFKKDLPSLYGKYDSSKIEGVMNRYLTLTSYRPEAFKERIELLKNIKVLLNEPWREILPEETDGTVKQDIAYMIRLYGRKNAFDKYWINNVLRPLLKAIYTQGRKKSMRR